MIFIVPIAIGWWANWYPGRRAGRRQLHRAADARVEVREGLRLARTLFFNLAHYVLRPWPWIIVGAVLDYRLPRLKDIQAAFPERSTRR